MPQTKQYMHRSAKPAGLRQSRAAWEFPASSFDATPYAQALLSAVRRRAGHWAGQLRRAAGWTQGDSALTAGYGAKFLEAAQGFWELSQAPDWEAARRLAGAVSFPRLTTPKGRKEDPLVVSMKRTWEGGKSALKPLLAWLNVSGEEAVEYETTEEAVLAAGSVTVSVPARAVTAGSAGNAAAGYINTLVSEVTGINYVTNTKAFSGGTDPEGDEDYRARILAGIGRLEGFGSAGYYEGIALEQAGVRSAQAGISADSSGATVYVWGDGAAVPEEAIGELQERLDSSRPLGVAVTVQQAATKKVAVGAQLQMREGADFAAASAALPNVIKAWLNQRSVGESVYMAQIQRLIMDTDPGVARVGFISSCKDHEGALGVVPIAGIVSLKEVV